MGSFVAKKALLGEKIEIINCESAVITGNRHQIFGVYEGYLQRGTHSKGPFVYRMPDRFVKRAIRGMLPYKTERGRAAFKSIKCYVGIPETLKNKNAETIKSADVSKLPNLKYTKVKDICIRIGAKIR